MAITRRQFIRRTGLATAGTLLGPGLFASPFVRRAFADLGDRYLVVIFLDGGNDGQNTVIPADNGGGNLRNDYEAHRFSGGGGIRLTPGAARRHAGRQRPQHRGAAGASTRASSG